jgi:hypothetical protein
VALPDAGTTGATLGAGMAYALHEGDAAPSLRTTVRAVGDQDTAALYEHRDKVALAAYDLGDPEAEVDVERQGDSDVARGQGREGILIILYERKLAKEHSKRRKKDTYVDAKILHQVAAGGLSGRQDDEAAAGGDSHG